MEGFRKQKRIYYSAGVLNGEPTLIGAFLFLFARILWFIQLFTDAAARKAANQAPPEGYTAGGIVGQSLLVLLIAGLIFGLVRSRRGASRLPRPMRYLLLNVLVVAWGMVHIVGNMVDLITYPELILILDVLSLAAALVAPTVLLQLADFRREPPDDTALLFIGIGGTAFSVIALLIYALVLKKSYSSFFRLMPELMFRLGAALFGLAGLLNAIKLRRAYPLAEPVVSAIVKPARRPAPKPAAREEAEEDAPDDWFAGFDAQTAAVETQRQRRPAAYEDDQEIVAAAPAPRQRERIAPAAEGAESLLAAARRQLSLPEEPAGPAEVIVRQSAPPRSTAKPPRPAGSQGTRQAAREISSQEALSRWQSKRTRRENEFEEERWQRQQLEKPPIDHPYAGSTVKRISCPDCGKRVPEDFPVCPRCGRPL